MKTVVILVGGAADEAQDGLDGLTPLSAARLRNATRLAMGGKCGLIPVPADGEPWRRASLLAQAFGVDVEPAHRLRRGPVEAWTLEVPPSDGSWVYRADLVTLADGVVQRRLASRVGIEETRELARALQDEIGVEDCRFDATGPGSMLVQLSGVKGKLPEGTPISAVLQDSVVEALPSMREGGRLREIMTRAQEVLSNHPVNEVRVDLGEDPANGIWLWGGGVWQQASAMSGLSKSAALVTRRTVGRGLAEMLGVEAFDLPSWPEGDRGEWIRLPELVSVLRDHELVVIDVDLPADAEDGGRAVGKVRALDRVDQVLLGPVMEVLDRLRPRRIVLAAAGAVSCETGVALAMPLPMAVFGDEVESDEVLDFNEEACLRGALGSMYLELCIKKTWDEEVWH